MSSDDVEFEYGRTSGGGGASALRDQQWPNPAAHAFDGVDALPGSTKPDPILVATDVQRSFGGLRAVAVDHLEVQRGAITALIGPNGAGKTTFFNLLTAFDDPDRGRIKFDGEDTAGQPSYLLAAKGMVRTFQLTKVLAKMSVLDNMMLAAQHQRGEVMSRAMFRRWKAQEEDVRTRSLEVLDQFNMTHMQDEFAGALSGGQRKLLEMARSLITQPRLIMLDEPMAGVNPALTQSLLTHVKKLRADGITVMFVEHDMDVVRDISDWVVVMAEGAIIAEGPPDAIGSNTQVIDAYLGSSHAALGEQVITGHVPHDEVVAEAIDEARGAPDD